MPSDAGVAQFVRDHALDRMRIAGKPAGARTGDQGIAVLNPYTQERIGSVPKATLEEVREAFAIAHAAQPKLTRAERAGILQKAAELVREHRDDIARLI